jgi:hypothetical protein
MVMSMSETSDTDFLLLLPVHDGHSAAFAEFVTQPLDIGFPVAPRPLPGFPPAEDLALGAGVTAATPVLP